MKIGQKEYRCGVCNEYAFSNILISHGFVCPRCETEFRRDDVGIFITKEPSEEWKRRNQDVWEGIKKINYPYPKYIELFTLR